MIERSGSGSIPLTSGSGSGRPKNMWLRWIRIRNTAGKDSALPACVTDPWTLLGVNTPVDLQLWLRHETLITEIARTAKNQRIATDGMVSVKITSYPYLELTVMTVILLLLLVHWQIKIRTKYNRCGFGRPKRNISVTMFFTGVKTWYIILLQSSRASLKFTEAWIKSGPSSKNINKT